jgi:hypothetical protein
MAIRPYGGSNAAVVFIRTETKEEQKNKTNQNRGAK